MKRIAIYARVSTSDKGQDPENQLVQLREWCAHAGHTIAGEYVEHESGRKDENGRKEFARLLQDAARREFDLVLFWSLDRFSREGMAQTIHYLSGDSRRSGYAVRGGVASRTATGARIIRALTMQSPSFGAR